VLSAATAHLAAMRNASRLLIAGGVMAAVIGITFHNGLLAVGGVVLLLAALLVRSIHPSPRIGHVARPKFGPTTVASTVGGDASRPIDFTPRD
jgi:hypothetical protein